ncbi:MAG: hypothetical protein IT446_10695, partial [Phycisphaerales bacterium]|nr:hypothetical protein [Phycisphaerales bacterium]
MRPRTITRTTIVLALSLVICASLQASDKKYILENDAMRITFADSSSGFDCLSIINRLAGNKRFVDPAGDDLGWPGLWQIELSRPPEGHGERQKMFVNNKEAGGVKTARYINIDGGKKLVFQWKNISLADEPGCMDVTATVSISAGRSPSSWTIDVDNRSRQWGTDGVTFPFLRTVCKSGTAEVLLPTGAFGGTLNRNNTSSYEGYYPYWSCSVQFLAFNQGDAGLYVGAHDGEGYIKTLKLTNNQHVMIERMAENTGVPRSAKIPAYPVIVSAY